MKIRIPNIRGWTHVSLTEQDPNHPVYRRAPHRRALRERAKQQRDAAKDETIRNIFQELAEMLR